jgi:autoinducer 2 (AI-2) kinase
MREQYVMVIDAGTGSCRAAIFNKEGRQISIAQREWSHSSLAGIQGSQIFDTKKNWELIVQCIRSAFSSKSIDPSQVKAVSATSMREGIVLYDSSGKEIWACPNVDSRATEEVTHLVKTGIAKQIYSIGGDWVSITAPPRLLWIKQHQPNIFMKIAHLGMLSDWILYKLSGEFVTDPSIGSSSAMFDIKKRSWSQTIVDICGLKNEVLPDIVESGNVIGEVTAIAASQTGIKEGTPVVTGGADTQMGLVGIGMTEPNNVTIVAGSFWQHTVLMKKAHIDSKVRLSTLCHAEPGQWMMEGIGFYSGLTMRWFRDAFCKEEKEKAKKYGTDAYKLMEEQAKKVPPGSNGVIGIFSNLMNSRNWVHASPSFMQFDILNPEFSGKKECIKAIEESAAYVAFGHLKIIESIIRKKIGQIVFTGGGSKGTLWPQIIADVLGINVSIPVVKESTALGCSLYAGKGAGWYDDVKEAAKNLVRMERTFEPNDENHQLYEKLYTNWLEVYDRSLKIATEGLIKPLWRAAGT